MNFTSAQSENLSPKEGITGLSLSPSTKERSLRGPTPHQNTYRNSNEILKRKVFRTPSRARIIPGLFIGFFSWPRAEGGKIRQGRAGFLTLSGLPLLHFLLTYETGQL